MTDLSPTQWRVVQALSDIVLQPVSGPVLCQLLAITTSDLSLAGRTLIELGFCTRKRDGHFIWYSITQRGIEYVRARSSAGEPATQPPKRRRALPGPRGRGA